MTTRLTALPAILALTLTLTACAATSSRQPYAGPVRPAQVQMVEHCTFISDINGTSMLYGLNAGTGLDNSRVDAFRKAEELGATHFVVRSSHTNKHGSFTSGDAYACP